MRAVYTPTPVIPGGAARLEATAPGGQSDATLTLYPARRSAVLTSAQLRAVLRLWTEAARDGQGTLEVHDAGETEAA
jgi:hypothetical protein